MGNGEGAQAQELHLCGHQRLDPGSVWIENAIVNATCCATRCGISLAGKKGPDLPVLHREAADKYVYVGREICLPTAPERERSSREN